MVMKSRLILLMITVLLSCNPVKAERIKDIVDIQGIRGNSLTGVGLVVGLAGTGDSAIASQQVLTNILRSSELVFSPQDLANGNIALVTVTAHLGPFSRAGSNIDVDVSSIGDAESLQGGMLLPTPLKGFDEQVYAVAQGGVSLGGWTASGDNASITKNHQLVGRIPNGAVVEREEIASFIEYIGGYRFITFNLRNTDFATAENITGGINQIYPDSSQTIDAGTIRVKIPTLVAEDGIAGFINSITMLNVKVDTPAIVVINERTGTIVVGENVGISTVAIAQGSLVVKIRETANVFQPVAQFSDAGNTEVVPETDIQVEEKEGSLIPVPQTVTVSELAKILNAIGATPRDLIAIFNAMKEAGALQAKLKKM